MSEGFPKKLDLDLSNDETIESSLNVAAGEAKLEHFKNQIPDIADAEERVILPRVEKSNVIPINLGERETVTNRLTAEDFDPNAMKEVLAAQEQRKKDAADILALRAKLKMDAEPLKKAA